MSQIRGTQPEEYAGALQHYDEIPQRYRLETYQGHYRGEDVWNHYAENVVLAENDSERMRRTLRLGGDSWLKHMTTRGRHHALATVEDANAWCEKLRSEKARRTCYEYYFLRVYDFYEYLKFHCRHPHLYNPLLLAAVNYEAARYIWSFRVDRRQDGDCS